MNVVLLHSAEITFIKWKTLLFSCLQFTVFPSLHNLFMARRHRRLQCWTDGRLITTGAPEAASDPCHATLTIVALCCIHFVTSSTWLECKRIEGPNFRQSECQLQHTRIYWILQSVVVNLKHCCTNLIQVMVNYYIGIDDRSHDHLSVAQEGLAWKYS